MESKTERLIFQPGESSWASWKCGGGAHLQDSESIHSAVKSPEAHLRQVLPYSGTEGMADTVIEIQIPHEVAPERRDLPA